MAGTTPPASRGTDGREPATMSVRHAAVWAMAGQYLSFAIQFITSVIISRLFLSPAEVGLFSIGLSAALIAWPCGNAKLTCEFRCTASTAPLAGSTTLIRLSAMRPRTVLALAPGPSKRMWFLASVLLTYTLPLPGWTAMLNSVVPTPLTRDFSVGVAALASIANRS